MIIEERTSASEIGWGTDVGKNGYVSLSWRMTDTTWHSFIAAIIAGFGSHFQEATSLEFGMGLDLTVSALEESLLLDLLRKFESVKLQSCPFDWRVFNVLQRTVTPSTVSPFGDSEAETERGLRQLRSSLRKLKPRSQLMSTIRKSFRT